MDWSSILPFLKQLATYGQLITASIAIVANSIATYSVYSQRSVARKRASIDFFIKTVMDKTMLDAFDHFKRAIAVLNAELSIEAFRETPAYSHVRSYLNVHELIAVGQRLQPRHVV